MKQTIEVKQMEQKKVLVKIDGTTVDDWNKKNPKSVLISLSDVKRWMAKFKAMGIKKGSEVLIFEHEGSPFFRKPGQAHSYGLISNNHNDLPRSWHRV